MMSGHGCFNQYLARMGKVEADICFHCDRGQVDSPQHTLFECVAWRRERSELVRSLDEIGEDEALAPNTLVPIMLRSAEGWGQVSTFAAKVMKKKMNAEWARQM